MQKLIVLLALLTSPAFAWTPEDVSVLLPLPPAAAFTRSIDERPLSTAAAGRKGALFPKSAFDLLPDLVRFGQPEQMYSELLHVVAVRLDPCFREGTKQSCRRQIRLVWQPLVPAGKAMTTLDAAVHTFHEFDAASWSQVVQSWPQTPGERVAPLTLGIHSAMQAEGFSGPFWKRLRTVLLENCGEKNLVRVSAMTLNGPLMWTFMGFDWPSGKELKIPRLSPPRDSIQSFVMDFDSLVKLQEFSATIAPAPVGQPDWLDFISDSLLFREARPEADFKTIASLALTLENPRLANPGTADCVSCHVAATVRLWNEARFPTWDWANEFSASRFTNKRTTINLAPPKLQTNRLRSFGFFENEPVVSARVINETSEVIDLLEAEL